MRKLLFISSALVAVFIIVNSCCKDKKKKSNGGDDDGGGSSTKIEMAVSPWPCLGQNMQQANSSLYSGPASTPTQKWKKKLGTANNHSVIIGADGTLYVNAQRMLYAVNPDDGSIKWSYNANMYLSESAVIDKNNIIYITGYESGMSFNTYGNVIAIRADSGIVKWTFNTGDSTVGGFWSTPNIGLEGYLYVTEQSTKKLFALNVKGAKVWEFDAPYSIIGAAAVDASGCIYITSHLTGSSGSLIAISQGGAQKWKVDFNSPSVPTPPAVGSNGYIYIGYNGYMYCYKNDGTLKWDHVVSSGDAQTRLSVGNDGSVYFTGAGVQTVYYCMKDGLQTFSDVTVSGNTTVGNDGNVYILSSNNLFSFNLSTQLKNWTYNINPSTTTSFLITGKGGVYYIVTDQGELIALN